MRTPLFTSLRFLPVVAAAGLAVSCDTPQKRGMRELGKIGVEPSGMALLESVESGDVQRLGWLVDVGVYTEQCDDRGRTPMRVAIDKGDAAAATKLLEAKANPNATAADGIGLLAAAVERDETAVVKKLLAAGAHTDGSASDGEKILPWAIRHDRVSSAKEMLQAGADPHQKDRSGTPLLHIALKGGHRDLAETLLAHGADAGAPNPHGDSTLQSALRGGLAEFAPRLVSAGADPDAVGADGSTLLDRAVATGDVPQISLLLHLGANPNHRPASATGATPLERAFDAADPSIFQAFLDRGVKPSGGNWDRYLWRAFARGQRGAIQQLLRRGANPNACTGGLHLLEAAAIRGDGSLVKLLADYGAAPGNALYFASARGDVGIAELMISCGASLNATYFPTLDTPLGVALRHRRDRVATLLIDHGADLALALPEGQSALHIAIATRCVGATKAMLAAGGDPNAPFALPVSPAFLQCVRPGVMRWILRKDTNATLLMLAADSGNIPLAKALIQAGAKRETWTKTTRLWPINFASRRDDVKMMRLFLGRDPQHEERRIEIRLSEQRARIFDAGGKEIFSTPVSTGKKGHATPTGEFVITNKYRDWKSTLYHEASMPFFQRFSCGDFGMHQGNVPGYPASHGCIRVPAGNAAKLFTITQSGDRVRIIP